MNVEIETEAAQFPEKEYINGICLAVQMAQNQWALSTDTLTLKTLYQESHRISRPYLQKRRTSRPCQEAGRSNKQALSTHAHCNENPIYVFLFWELRSLSPNDHIHVSVSDLNISRIGPQSHIWLKHQRQTDPGNI